MNKIMINPHHCSEEEYQELKDYLTDKTWDWQEISSGETEKKDDRKTIEVLQHTIAYSYQDWEGEPNECDIEHLEKMIKEGFNSGELCTLDNDIEHHGWWGII